MQAVTGINNSNDRQDFRRNGRETENVNEVCAHLHNGKKPK